MAHVLRIQAPDADTAARLAAYLVVDGATEAELNGAWVVDVPLRAASRYTVPRCLAAVRTWLAECDLPATTFALDGHTHLIRVSLRSRPGQEPVAGRAS